MRAPTSGQDRPTPAVSDGDRSGRRAPMHSAGQRKHSALHTEDGHRHHAQRHTGTSFGSMAMSASEAWKRLFPLIEQVNDPQEPPWKPSRRPTPLPRLRRLVAPPGDSPSPAVPRPTPSACRAASPRRSRLNQSPRTDRPPARRHVNSTTSREDQRHRLGELHHLERTILKRINHMIEEAARDPAPRHRHARAPVP